MDKQIMWNRMRHSSKFMLGAFIMLFLIFFALFARYLAPHDPNAINPVNRLMAPQWFSGQYPLGTDSTGRCILSRLLVGATASVQVAFVSTIIMAAFGTSLGVLAGYRSGIVDTVIMRATEVTMAVPTLTLGIVIMSVFGASLMNLIVVLVACSWISFAKIARNQVMVIKNREFVQASHALGATDLRIMVKQILPNISTPLIIQISGAFGSCILIESSLSYLYLGIQAPNASWGNMIADGRNYLAVAPWLVIVPGVALMVAVLGANFLGDGLRDVLDPKQIR